jgi:thiamine biosynthesis lipoprotein
MDFVDVGVAQHPGGVGDAAREDPGAWLRRARPLLGTFVEISIAGAPPAELEAAAEAAFAAVAMVHRLMSFHDEASDIGRLNRSAFAAAVVVHPWTFEVLDIANDLCRRSAGAFDIAIAPVLQELGLLPRHPGDALSVTAGRGGEDAIELLSDGRVRFRDGVRLDVGGIAKGYAVDRAIEALRGRGIAEGIVNAGGDLAAFGPHPHAIHIRDPRRPQVAMCEVKLRDSALASSGGRFDPSSSTEADTSAVIDPRNGRQVSGIVGASVRAPLCVFADALTKVAMVAGKTAGPLLAAYGASALFVTASGDVHVTADWQDGVHLAA